MTWLFCRLRKKKKKLLKPRKRQGWRRSDGGKCTKQRPHTSPRPRVVGDMQTFTLDQEKRVTVLTGFPFLWLAVNRRNTHTHKYTDTATVRRDGVTWSSGSSSECETYFLAGVLKCLQEVTLHTFRHRLEHTEKLTLISHNIKTTDKRWEWYWSWQHGSWTPSDPKNPQKPFKVNTLTLWSFFQAHSR